MPDLNFIPHPLTGTPFGYALDLSLILAVLSWLASLVTREQAWIERRWEVIPPLCCLIVAAAADFESARLNLMTGLVIIWSLRLSYNCWRKGGFSKGGGDYRFDHVKRQMGAGFWIYSVTYMLLGHMLTIWLFTAPIHTAWLWRDAPLNWLDIAASIVFLAFWIGEAVADQQMWDFQQEKKRKIAAGEDVVQPFINTGLFRYSRHPAWFCELGMWWVFYLFAVAASGEWIHWTGLGFIMVTVSFLGAVRLTEGISVERYPSYKTYQAATPSLIPGLRLRRR